MSYTRRARSRSGQVLRTPLLIALTILLCLRPGRNADGEDGALVPDKPHYRAGEALRIKYRLPKVEFGQHIRLIVEKRSRTESWVWHPGDLFEKREETVFSVDLDPSGVGVAELPALKHSEKNPDLYDGPLRLTVEHPLLEVPPARWVWVFPDVDAWPHALSVVGGNRVRIRDDFTVAVKAPTGAREPELGLRFFRFPSYVVEGGAVCRAQPRIERMEWVEEGRATAVLIAPDVPGTYELRLLEMKTGAVLGCMPVEVMLPSAENVEAEDPDGPVAADTGLDLRLEGLAAFRATIRHAGTRRAHSSFFGENGLVRIRTPRATGSYELLVTTYYGDDPVVARIPLEIVQGTEETIPLLDTTDRGRVYEAGDTVTVRIASREELSGTPRHLAELMNEHGALALRLTLPRSSDTEDQELCTVYDSIRLGQQVSFRVTRLGSYHLGLGAVGRGGWLPAIDEFTTGSDSLVFRCEDPGRSGVIRLDKSDLRPGAEVKATLEPVAGWPAQEGVSGWVSVLTPTREQLECDWEDWQRVNLVLPVEAGVYQMRWYDGPHLISTALFRVPIELESDRLSLVGGRMVGYGEPIRVRVEIDDRPLFSSDHFSTVMVTLLARGEMSPRGTWKEPRVVGSHVVKASGTFEFAPPFPGRYEVRLYAGELRSDPLPQYLLARIPLEVTDPAGEVPVPGDPDAPEPTDLPFDAKKRGSAIADEILMADVHCPPFHPPPFDGEDAGTVVEEPRENRVVVRFVREFEGRFFQVHDALHSGEEFFVELLFERAPADLSPRAVRIDTPVGQRTVSASSVAGEPAKFRSGAVVLDVSAGGD